LTLLIDAAPLVAIADPNEPLRQAILEILASSPGPLIIPSPVTAEIDYLLGRRFGNTARRAFLRDLAAGRFIVPAPDHEDYATILDLEARYQDLSLGLADCALVTLAARHRTTHLLSFDERHFRVVPPIGGGAFTILPADSGQSPEGRVD
jgi:predicted nucleic acid-binding protein